jgi:hypothetical protein
MQTTLLQCFVCYSCYNALISMVSNELNDLDAPHHIPTVFDGSGFHKVTQCQGQISIGPNLRVL